MADWDGLRRDLEGGVTPPLDALRERRRHRQQRRAIAAACTVTLVGTASGVALLGHTEQRDRARQPIAAPPAELSRIVNGAPLPPPRDYTEHVVTDVDFVTADTGFAIGLRCVGDACDVATWRTDDGGRTWGPPADVRAGVPRSSFHEESPLGGVRSLRMVDAHVGYAFNPDLYVTTDGARTWERVARTSKVTSVSVVGDSVWLAERGCARDVDCDLVVSRGHTALGSPKPFRVPETNGALAIVRRAGAGKAFLLSWDAPDPKDAALHRTLDGGRTWRRVKHPCADASAALMSAAEGRPLWVACTTPSGRRVHLSTDDGASWTTAGALPAEGDLTDLVAWAATDAYVALQNPGRLLVTSDGGRTWRQAEGTGKAYGYANVEVAGPAHAWAMGDAGQLWRTTDGRRWERLPLPPRAPAAPRPVSESFSSPREEGAVVRGISFLDARRGWAVAARCTRPEGGTCRTSLRRTTDGGVTWEAVPGPDVTWTSRAGLHEPPTVSLTAVTFANDRTGWVYGGDVYRTDDGGTTWREVDFGGDVHSIQPHGDAYWAVAWDTCDGWPCRPRFLRGALADERPAELSGYELGDSGGAGGLIAVDAETAYWVDYYDARPGDEPRLVTGTTDGGATWQTHPAPCQRYQERTVAAPAPGVVWVLCANPRGGRLPTVLAQSTDGGRTWRERPVPLEQGGKRLRALTPEFGWFLNYFDGVFVTRDGGATWEKAQVPPRFSSVQLVDPEHGWVLAEDSELYRTTDGRRWELLGRL